MSKPKKKICDHLESERHRLVGNWTGGLQISANQRKWFVGVLFLINILGQTLGNEDRIRYRS